MTGSREKILEEGRLLRCSFCSFACTHGHKLRLHIERHIQPSVITCPFCLFKLPYRLQNKYKFREHLYLHLDEDLKCTSCSYTHRNFGQFLRHVRTHSDFFVCDVCDHTSRNKLFFTQHMRRHEAEVRVTLNPCLECPACGVQGSTHQETVLHVQGHVKDLEFGCRTCGKMLLNKRAFKRHLLSRHFLLV